MNKLKERVASLQDISDLEVIMVLTLLTGQIALYTKIGVLILFFLVSLTIFGMYYWQVKKIKFVPYTIAFLICFLFRTVIAFFFYDERKRNILVSDSLIQVILYPELGYYWSYRLFGPVEVFILFLIIGSGFWMIPILLIVSEKRKKE